LLAWFFLIDRIFEKGDKQRKKNVRRLLGSSMPFHFLFTRSTRMSWNTLFAILRNFLRENSTCLSRTFTSNTFYRFVRCSISDVSLNTGPFRPHPPCVVFFHPQRNRGAGTRVLHSSGSTRHSHPIASCTSSALLRISLTPVSFTASNTSG
jgi:hypothetical protein